MIRNSIMVTQHIHQIFGQIVEQIFDTVYCPTGYSSTRPEEYNVQAYWARKSNINLKMSLHHLQNSIAS